MCRPRLRKAVKEDGAAAAPSQQLGCRQRVAAAGEVGDQLGMWLQNGARLGATAPVHEHPGPAGCGPKRRQWRLLTGGDRDGAAKQRFDELDVLMLAPVKQLCL